MADRWQQIIDVFHAAVDRDDVSREAFLDEACGHDASPRAEVEALVAAHQEAGSFGERALVLPADEALTVSSKLPTEWGGVSFSRTAGGGRCAQCGAALILEPGIPGWCPQCLLGLALHEAGGALDLLRPGRVLSNR